MSRRRPRSSRAAPIRRARTKPATGNVIGSAIETGTEIETEAGANEKGKRNANERRSANGNENGRRSANENEKRSASGKEKRSASGSGESARNGNATKRSVANGRNANDASDSGSGNAAIATAVANATIATAAASATIAIEAANATIAIAAASECATATAETGRRRAVATIVKAPASSAIGAPIGPAGPTAATEPAAIATRSAGGARTGAARERPPRADPAVIRPRKPTIRRKRTRKHSSAFFPYPCRLIGVFSDS